ncbi:hypothetical protein ACA910_004156 [Epithemia clementina (nom. ined.)]
MMEVDSVNDNQQDNNIVDQARDLRLQGNHLFRQQHEYQAALGFYTKALALLDDRSDGSKEREEEMILNYCNRSACYFVMEEYEAAKSDALTAWIDLSNYTSIKAAYRLAKALVALKEYATAKELIEEHVLSPESNKPLTDEETKSFQEIRNQVAQVLSSSQAPINPEEETTICFVNRPISIKEFVQQKELGFGNFSEICIVTHKFTKERFALKKIAKKQAADLAKRQHPNVYNEIQMERRVLLERLPPTCPFVIRMYHAFQDYEHLYYLMELHDVWSDLWSQLRWKEKGGIMVGCHRSQAKFWLYQLVLALEHLHRHGIVHRDIKAENILLDRRGHLVLIDFGTAKDLVLTDLNGPEFVGTPDFMSPEAVTGDDNKNIMRLKKEQQQTKKSLGPALWTADLWALGALCYIMQTGVTPFWTTSPYLAFLRIQRGLLTRHNGIIHDDCWDFMQKLMKTQPEHRLGAQAFQLGDDSGSNEGDKQDPKKKILECGDGYGELKQHPYLAPIHKDYTTNPRFREQAPIPSLRDLCYRAVADMALRDCQEIDLCEQHPPGVGSSRDLLRLSSSPADRSAVLHLLDRQKLLGQEPRLWGRFFSSPVEARLLAKLRPNTRDFVGLTQMNDDQGKAPHASEAQQFDKKPQPMELLEFVQICSPLFCNMTTSSDDTAADLDATAQRKQHVKLLKKCVARINKLRPKLVVVSSAVTLDDSLRKLLARINESIPVVLHEPKDGEQNFFSFWLSGVQGICLSYQLAMATVQNTDQETVDSSQTNPSAQKSSLYPLKLQKEQWEWLREQLELVRMSKHPLFCFINGPPLCSSSGFPLLVLKKLARGRTLALFGPAASDSPKKARRKLQYRANEMVPKDFKWSSNSLESNDWKKSDTDNNDSEDISVKSTDSNEDQADEFTMVIESSMSTSTGLRWIRVDPIHADEWSYELEDVSAEATS